MVTNGTFSICLIIFEYTQGFSEAESAINCDEGLKHKSISTAVFYWMYWGLTIKSTLYNHQQ